MNVTKLLLKEEKKLLETARKVEADLSRVRAAINALSSNGRGGHKLKGRKLSAAHRRAIREGIRKAKEKAAR